MKPAILSILLLSTAFCYGQRRENFWLKQGAAATSWTASGFMFRRAEIRKDSYIRYAAVHPNANRKWADPKISFRNKYKAWPSDQRPAYFLSKSVLVFASDGFHFDNMVGSLFMAGGLSINLSLYEKPKFKTIVAQTAASWIFYGCGRALADVVYPKIQ